MYEEHPDGEVRAAIIRLSDALCQWERNTERKSVLIVREKNYVYRAQDGKPGIPEFITDQDLVDSLGR
jgi:hypothetical protein